MVRAEHFNSVNDKDLFENSVPHISHGYYFKVFSHFLTVGLWDGMRKSYEGLTWSGFSFQWRYYEGQGNDCPFFQNYTSYSQPSHISLTNDKYNYDQY